MRRWLLGVVLLAPALALGWGRDGHRIVAFVAQDALSSEARAQLQKLGMRNLADVANRLDEARDGSRAWHYENRPVCGAAAACAGDECLGAQLARHLRELSQPAAVAVVTHLVADLHQPLHLADNADRGGNRVAVAGRGLPAGLNLHALWDRWLVLGARGRSSNGRYARELAARFAPSRAGWIAGTPAAWADETAALARAHYRSLPGFACGVAAPMTLAQADLDRALAMVPEQLAKAGWRLAALIEQHLDRR